MKTELKVHIAITHISNNKNQEDIIDALRELQKLKLDANVRHMIELYLNKDA